jgi:hypothetical protein
VGPVQEGKRLVVHVNEDRFDVYIGRPSKWGNPYSHLAGTKAHWRVASREEAVLMYARWLKDNPGLIAEAKKELRGKVLGCWCAPQLCHGEVLARVANEPRIHGEEPCEDLECQTCLDWTGLGVQEAGGVRAEGR